MNCFELQSKGLGGYGSFQNAIMESIKLADLSNLRKLYKSFPDLVLDYLNWQGLNNLEIKNFIDKK